MFQLSQANICENYNTYGSFQYQFWSIYLFSYLKLREEIRDSYSG